MVRKGRVKVPHSGAGDDESRRDRISGFPDDVLLQILVLLPLVEAVRTCVLSRRWRHVWTRLPLLEFADEEASGVSSFADLVAGVIRGYATDVITPDVLISVRCCQYTFYEAVCIAASAFLVAYRATTRFVFFMSPDAVNLLEWDDSEDDEEESAPPLYLPCFPKVKEFALTFPGVDLRMPRTGTFARLTKLYIFGVRFTDDGEGINNVVSRRCPCLQDLELHTIEGLKMFVLLSLSLLRLRLFKVLDLERLLVTAKYLGEMEVTRCFVLATERTWMLLNLPKLEQLHWEDRCPDEVYRQRLPSQLWKLTVIELSPAYLIVRGGGHRSHFAMIMQAFERIEILRLVIPIAPIDQKNLIKNANIPFYWELDLTVNKNKHMFGPTILYLLDRRSCVRKLSVQIIYDREAENIIPPCSSNCGCRKIQNQRDDKITLHYLKWFVMKFNGTEDETSFLYSIVRNAKELRKVSIVFSAGVEPPKMFLHTLHKLSPSGCTFEFSCDI